MVWYYKNKWIWQVTLSEDSASHCLKNKTTQRVSLHSWKLYSHSQVLWRIAVHKIFAKVIGEFLWWKLFSEKLQDETLLMKDSIAGSLPWILRNCSEHFLVNASVWIWFFLAFLLFKCTLTIACVKPSQNSKYLAC